jgi:hypothetical protein
MRKLMLLIAVMVVATACDSTSRSTPGTTIGTRPASPVRITLVSPTSDAVVHGTTLHVVVTVSGGTVVQNYSTNISPTKGHVHLYLNSQLVYMSYTLHQDLAVHPGLTYAMYIEWVASDHLPFSPRDVTQPIFFTVAAS